MSHFDKAFNWLMKIEGGYVNDPNDRGGETKYGISKRSYPDLDIKNLTRAVARGIYFRDYWLKSRCDRLPRVFAWAAFGAAVHHGPNTSIRLLQKSLRVEPDGIYGPITHKAAWMAEDHWETVLKDLLARRALFMHEIVKSDSTQAGNHRGWLIRLFSLQSFILEIEL